MSQDLQNGITVPTNSDDYALTEDLAEMGDSSNVVIIVPNETARDALTEHAGMTVYRLDIGRLEAWNGSRWAVTATTEIGHDFTTPLDIAGTSYATVATVNCSSLGGPLKLSYNGVVENANSGQNRTADVQWLIDGNPFGGVTFNVPLVSGFTNPATSVAMERKITAAAGDHVVELQTRASAGSSVRNVLFSLTVQESPA